MAGRRTVLLSQNHSYTERVQKMPALISQSGHFYSKRFLL